MTAVFAIPGDKDRRTGGFIYDATVLRVLNDIGCPTAHLELPDAFPEPTTADMDATFALLQAVPADQAIIIDGLVFGALDPARLARVSAPMVAMVHHPLGLETGLAPDLAAYLMRNEADALQHAAAIVVPSPHTAEILQSQFGADGAKTHIALPGFTRPQIASAPEDPPLILSVGLLADRKGHDVLLRALESLQDLPWQCEIVGKRHMPATADALLALRDDFGLNTRVMFRGEVDERTLQERYAAASLFALATRYEGYGMVLSEAMLHGLPVVSTRTGAVPDTVGDAGLLVDVDDDAAFAAALRIVLSEPKTRQRLQSASHAKAASLPTWEDTARVMAQAVASVQG